MQLMATRHIPSLQGFKRNPLKEVCGVSKIALESSERQSYIVIMIFQADIILSVEGKATKSLIACSDNNNFILDCYYVD